MKELKTQPKEVTVLRKIRDEFGMSREKLAQAIGCSAKTIERAESGEREPQLTAEQWLNFQALLKQKKMTIPRKLSEKVSA